MLREGTDITLIANGIMVAEALEAARQLEQEGKRSGHRHVYPEAYRSDAGENYAEKTGRIVTCETTAFTTGWGRRWRKCWWKPVRCPCVGWGEGTIWSGGHAGLLAKEYGLTAHDIVSAARELL